TIAHRSGCGTVEKRAFVRLSFSLRERLDPREPSPQLPRGRLASSLRLTPESHSPRNSPEDENQPPGAAADSQEPLERTTGFEPATSTLARSFDRLIELLECRKWGLTCPFVTESYGPLRPATALRVSRACHRPQKQLRDSPFCLRRNLERGAQPSMLVCFS